MIEHRPCTPGYCPVVDPETGRYNGTSIMQGKVDGGEVPVTVNKADLINAARLIRVNTLFGVRARSQHLQVDGVSMGEPVTAQINGATLLSEARQVRIA